MVVPRVLRVPLLAAAALADLLRQAGVADGGRAAARAGGGVEALVGAGGALVAGVGEVEPAGEAHPHPPRHDAAVVLQDRRRDAGVADDRPAVAAVGVDVDPQLGELGGVAEGVLAAVVLREAELDRQRPGGRGGDEPLELLAGQGAGHAEEAQALAGALLALPPPVVGADGQDPGRRPGGRVGPRPGHGGPAGAQGQDLAGDLPAQGPGLGQAEPIVLSGDAEGDQRAGQRLVGGYAQDVGQLLGQFEQPRRVEHEGDVRGQGGARPVHQGRDVGQREGRGVRGL